MIKHAILVVSVAAIAAPGLARADAPAETSIVAPPPRPVYQHAISLQLATLDNRGLAVQLERASRARKKVSVALAIGGRASAQGDYASRTFGVGVEVRRWLRRPEAMTGWYVGLRTDLARTKVSEVIDGMDDRSIGALTTWTTGVSTGYRWVLFHKVELTPSIGAAMVVEGGMHGMSPTTSRGAAVVGLTAGAVF